MDFHSLARRDLQALCKLNAIPANITNVAMADALKSLDIVEGLEDFLNRSPQRKAVTAAKVPRTGRRTSTQSKPIADVSESVQPMTKSTRRTTRRAISDEIMQESKTPAIRSSRKTVECAKTENEGTEDVEKKGVTDTPALATYSRRSQVARKSSVKEVSTVQKVYSTRRSARLTENKDGEVKEEKIDSLVTELSRIDLEDGSDNKNSSGIDAEVVLQESVEKSDVVALETVNNLEGEALDEVNAVQDDSTKSLVNEKQGDVQEEIVDAEVVLQESVEKSDVVALETVNNLEGEALDEVNAVQDDSTKSLVNEKQGNVQEEIVDALGEESKQLDESSFVASEVINDEVNAVQDDSTKGLVNEKQGDVQEEIVDALGEESKQLDESSFVADSEVINDEVNAVQDDSTKGLVNEKQGDVQEEIVDALGEESKQLDESSFVADSEVIDDEDNKVPGYPMDSENFHEQKKPDEAAPESGMEVEEDDAQEIVVDELKVKSEQCFDTLDESHLVHELNANSVMIEDEDCEVEKSLMGSDNPREQLDLGAGEESETNMNMESVVSTGGDSYMTNSDESKDDILDNNDPKENADQTEDEMDSEKSFLDEVEPSIPDILNNDYPKEIATGTEISSVAPFLSSGGAENKPVTKTPSVKGNSVSDDKENINGNGMMFVPTAEEAKKNKKNELNEKSLRELTKLLREKLQISKNTAEEIGKVTKERPALQKLEDNCQR